MGISNLYLGTLELLVLQTLKWGPMHGYATGNNRQAKFYTITRKGRRHLETEAARWHKHAGAVAAVLASSRG